MPSRDLIVGLSISGGSIQAVALERLGPTVTLLAIDDWESGFLSGSTNGDNPARQSFQRRLKKFMTEYGVTTTKVSVALDTGLLFVNSLPIEQGLTRTEINDHVKWELSQYYPTQDPSEFITDVHVLAERSSGAYNEALSVSVRRHDASALTQAVAGAGLQLHIVDADHFAADTALRINYPDTYRKYIALVGIKESRLDVSLIRNGSLEAYRYMVVHSNREIAQSIASLARKTPGIHSITAYGPFLDRELLTGIRRGSPILVEALNPFRHINVSDSLRLADYLSVPAYRFAASVGVALRRD